MQFILVDSSCLGGWCIRVFKKEYATEDKPDMEDVISDKVDFYCLTYAIGHGVLDELWTKAGKSKELGSFDNIVFKQKDIIHGGWRIWRARQEVKQGCFISTCECGQQDTYRTMDGYTECL